MRAYRAGPVLFRLACLAGLVALGFMAVGQVKAADGDDKRKVTAVVTSRDGTRIAVDKWGTGPALILVGGALSDRSGAAELAQLLAAHFTVYAYDRRGRVDSGDTQPYSVQREIEDIDALIGSAGGSAFVYGKSSGAGLAVAIASRVKATTLVMDGGASLGPMPFMRPTADKIAASIPGAKRLVVEGQAHDVSAKALAPLLLKFFA